MPKKVYINRTFFDKSLYMIEQANEIIEDIQSQGYDLTLRQLYYQFVSRYPDTFPNTMKSYNRLGTLINNARLAGLVDWDAIVDRTRNLVSWQHWDHPRDSINNAARQFEIDKWETQNYRPEVWVEKEALAGVIEKACSKLDIPFFCCRGYVSQSEMWRHSLRLKRINQSGQRSIIIHLGDHDPSGIDMTRDIVDRASMFAGVQAPKVQRIALNMPQVRKHNLPPNPAKETDSRFNKYITKFGPKSWELDALEPKVLDDLITKKVLTYRDEDLWDAAMEKEEGYQRAMEDAAKNFNWDGV